jgi:GDPmannose 4,6-dehydratase
MSARRALITGITGQDGSYLADFLLERGYEVHGLVRRSPAERLERIDHIRHLVRLHEGDLLDSDSLTAALRAAQPDEVYNLATPRMSERTPVLTAEVGGVGVVRLLEAVRSVAPEARLFHASCGEMFGHAAEEPQTERTPLHPRSVYAGAKAFAHAVVAGYRDTHGLHASSGILFSHESPRSGLHRVMHHITWHAAAIKLGMTSTLPLSGLETERDWGFALDYVRAMWLMLQQDAPEDFVIATGTAHSARACLDLAFDHAGLTVADHVQAVATTGSEPSGHLVGDASKAQHVLGWQPEVGFEDLVRMMVEADLALLRFDPRARRSGR